MVIKISRNKIQVDQNITDTLQRWYVIGITASLLNSFIHILSDG